MRFVHLLVVYFIVVASACNSSKETNNRSTDGSENKSPEKSANESTATVDGTVKEDDNDKVISAIDTDDWSVVESQNTAGVNLQPTFFLQGDDPNGVAVYRLVKDAAGVNSFVREQVSPLTPEKTFNFTIAASTIYIFKYKKLAAIVPALAEAVTLPLTLTRVSSVVSDLFLRILHTKDGKGIVSAAPPLGPDLKFSYTKVLNQLGVILSDAIESGANDPAIAEELVNSAVVPALKALTGADLSQEISDQKSTELVKIIVDEVLKLNELTSPSKEALTKASTATSQNESPTGTSDKIAPTAGAILAATDVTATSFTLNWESATDNVTPAASLTYFVCSGQSLVDVSTFDKCSTATMEKDFTANITSLAVTGKAGNTTYHYSVIVKDAAGNVAIYPSSNVTTANPNDIPPTAGIFAAPSGVSDSGLTVNWTVATDVETPASALQYYLCSATSAALIDTVPKCLLATKEMDYTLNTLTRPVTGKLPDTVYFFNVIVKDGAGNTTLYPGTSTQTDGDATPPTAGVFSAVTGRTSSGFTLHWTAGFDAGTTTSTLEYKVCSGVNAAAINSVAGCLGAVEELGFTANALSLVISGKAPSTTYYYNVIVSDGVGLQTIYPGTSVTTASSEQDVWSSTLVNGTTPAGRYGHSQIWTGSEMIVWGGYNGNRLATGARYNPITNTWTPVSTASAPTARESHTAMWTGKYMLIWGGGDSGGLATTGGRYDPATDTWSSLSSFNAPTPVSGTRIFWTGSHMLVWASFSPATIGLYDPETDVWTTQTTPGGPGSMLERSAVWAGDRLFVFGGYDGFNTTSESFVYIPATNTWSAVAVTDKPSGRRDHVMLWTGSRVLVWGGLANSLQVSDGGIYDPILNSWTAITSTSAPSETERPAAVWTGSRMLIFGGGNNFDGGVNTGGSYNPENNTWAPTTTTGAPLERYWISGVWTGRSMVVWGGDGGAGYLQTGGVYTPAKTSPSGWVEMSPAGTKPSLRSGAKGVWSGREFIVWGNDDPGGNRIGGKYNPTSNLWTVMSDPGVSFDERENHAMVWTGRDVLIWGGNAGSGIYSSGMRYNPAANNWTSLPNAGAPTQRMQHSAVWTGKYLMTWGGADPLIPTAYNDGHKYDGAPDTVTWSTLGSSGAPSARVGAYTAWTGRKMLIWSGSTIGGALLSDGAAYDLDAGTWSPINSTNAPVARAGNVSVWTGSEFIIWGGKTAGGTYVNTGSRYNPITNTWATMSTVNAPVGAMNAASVWAGNRMIVWGGQVSAVGYSNTGAMYDPVTDTWEELFQTTAPTARERAIMVWDGVRLILWGGQDATTKFDDIWINSL